MSWWRYYGNTCTHIPQVCKQQIPRIPPTNTATSPPQVYGSAFLLGLEYATSHENRTQILSSIHLMLSYTWGEPKQKQMVQENRHSNGYSYLSYPVDLSTCNWSLPWDVGVANSISTKGWVYPPHAQCGIIFCPKNHESLKPSPLGNDYYWWERYNSAFSGLHAKIECFSIQRIY